MNSSKHGGDRSYALDGPPDFGISDIYIVMRLLGEGGSGQTWLCQEVKTRATVAIKFIRRPIPKVMLPMLMHEIKIQAELGEGHMNLVKAKEVLLTPTHLGIVMEYAAGGCLTTYVTDKWETTDDRGGLFLSEAEARYFFIQFLSAVEYLHNHRVAHRDLKLDNIVLDGSKPPRIKVCDFGFAKNWDREANMFTQIGTPVYMSPQLISSKNTNVGYDATKADVWACGVLLFVMLLGMFPYDHTEHPDPNSSDAHVEVWLQQIKCSWRESPRVAEYAKKLSDECRDMLDKMFDLDEKRRIDISGIKKHAWFKLPVGEVYEAALEDIATAQKAIDAAVDAGKYQNAKRDQQLQEILDMAGKEHNAGGEPHRRIDLTRVASQFLEDAERKSNAAMPESNRNIEVILEKSESFPVSVDTGPGGHGHTSAAYTNGNADCAADVATRLVLNAEDSAARGRGSSPQEAQSKHPARPAETNGKPATSENEVVVAVQ